MARALDSDYDERTSVQSFSGAARPRGLDQRTVSRFRYDTRGYSNDLRGAYKTVVMSAVVVYLWLIRNDIDCRSRIGEE